MPLTKRRAFLALAAAITAAALASSPLAAEIKTFDIVIKDGKVVGPKSARVTQGDRVILSWTSDKPMSLHLHGYDIERQVGPDRPTEMRLDARATGRFPVEVHTEEKGGHGHAALFHLEVYPK